MEYKWNSKSYLKSHLNSLQCDIAMLQETHLTKEETIKLKQQWVGQIFFSSGMKASRGVCNLKEEFIYSLRCDLGQRGMMGDSLR